MAPVNELLNVVRSCEIRGRLRCSAASIGYRRRIRKGLVHSRRHAAVMERCQARKISIPQASDGAARAAAAGRLLSLQSPIDRWARPGCRRGQYRRGFSRSATVILQESSAIAAILARRGGADRFVPLDSFDFVGDMKSVHAGMGIQGKHFNALVQDLGKTLNKFKVPTKEQKELVAILAPMKKDTVTR